MSRRGRRGNARGGNPRGGGPGQGGDGCYNCGERGHISRDCPKGGGRRGGGGRGRGGGTAVNGVAVDFVDEQLKIRLTQKLREFRDGEDDELFFPCTHTNVERRFIHAICGQLGLVSKSRGKGDNRFLTVRRKKAQRSCGGGGDWSATGGGGGMATLFVKVGTRRALDDYFGRWPASAAERARVLGDGGAAAGVHRRREAERQQLRALAAQEAAEAKQLAEAALRQHQAAQEALDAEGSDGGGDASDPHNFGDGKSHAVHKKKARGGGGGGGSLREQRKQLPIYQFRDSITASIRDAQVTVISGETGCGKSTQVPQYVLEDCARRGGTQANIVVTQPRRLSAISLAERVAQERGEKVGASVGFNVRLESTKSKNTRLLFCTTGVLLRRLTAPPPKGGGGGGGGGGSGAHLLPGVTHIVVDEVHERDRNGDFLLVVLRDLLPRRPDLRVILMSATLHVDTYVNYFSGCGCWSRIGLHTNARGANEEGGGGGAAGQGAAAVAAEGGVVREVATAHVKGSVYPVQRFFLEDVLRQTGFANQLPGFAGARGTPDDNVAIPGVDAGGAGNAGAAAAAAAAFRCPLCGRTNFRSAEEFGTHAGMCGLFGGAAAAAPAPAPAPPLAAEDGGGGDGDGDDLLARLMAAGDEDDDEGGNGGDDGAAEGEGGDDELSKLLAGLNATEGAVDAGIDRDGFLDDETGRALTQSERKAKKKKLTALEMYLHARRDEDDKVARQSIPVNVLQRCTGVLVRAMY